MTRAPAFPRAPRSVRSLAFGLLLATAGCQKHPAGPAPTSAAGSRDAAGTRVAANIESANGGSAGNNANKALAPEPPTHALRRCFPLRPAWDDAAVADLLDRAADLFDTGDYQGALVCAEEAARQAPRSVEAHHNRAVALLHLERLDEARALCERVLSEQGASADAYCLLGIIRSAAGTLDEAIGCFNKALYLQQDHYKALVHLALLHEQRGEEGPAANFKRRAERVRGGQSS